MSTSRSDWITILMEQEEERRRRHHGHTRTGPPPEIREEIERSRKTAHAYKKKALDYTKRGKPEMASNYDAGATDTSPWCWSSTQS